MDTMAKPSSIALDAMEAREFENITRRQSELAARQASVQQFLKTVVAQGEQRLTELQQDAQKLHTDTQKLWLLLKAKYQLDLDHINYDLSEDGKSIVPTAVKL
jgi:uncharacterized protein HemX